MKITLVMSFVKITTSNVTFCISNHLYQNNENLDHCSLKIYPLTTFLNQTDNGNKSHCGILLSTKDSYASFGTLKGGGRILKNSNQVSKTYVYELLGGFQKRKKKNAYFVIYVCVGIIQNLCKVINQLILTILMHWNVGKYSDLMILLTSLQDAYKGGVDIKFQPQCTMGKPLL